MTSLLDQMRQASTERVTAAMRRESFADLERRAGETPAAPALELSPSGFDVIAELKLRSPAAGVLKDAAHDWRGRVAAYARAGAAAVSVLTEPTRFDGSLEHLEQAARVLAPLGVPAAEEMPLLRYPLRVANKEEVLARAIDARVEIGSWFEIPLHPAGTRMEDFGYAAGKCPEAERASREVVNLPTHLKVDQRTAEKTLDFLARNAKPA